MKKGACLVLGFLLAAALCIPAPVFATGNGTLKLTSLPAGADVYIDGSFQKAVTPCELALPEGEHKVELKIPGYDAYTNETVSVTAGATTDLPAVTIHPALPDVADADHIVTVTTLDDKARWSTAEEMDALTVSALKADAATPISLREAIAAIKNEPSGNGHYRIEFDASLSEGTIHLFKSDGSDFPVPDGMFQNLYIEKRGDLTINGDIDRDGTPDITLDASLYGEPGTVKSTVLNVYASDVYLEGLAFRGSGSPTDPDDPSGTLGTLLLRVPDGNTETYDVRNVYVLGCTFTDSDFVGVATCGAPGNAGTAFGGDRTASFTNLVFAGNTFEETALFSFAGAGDEDYNAIDGFTAAANTFRGRGIGLIASDAHSWYVFGSDSGPIEYCSHNKITDVLICGNDIATTESDAGLIHIGTANLGNSDNLVENVTIRNNRAKAGLSSPVPGSPELVSYSNVEIVNADCGADARFTPYTTPACRHNTANNVMRGITIADNTFEMGNSRCFSIVNVNLGYTEKSGMDATGNRMEGVAVSGNTIVSSCGARIYCVGSDGTRESNDVSGNSMSDIRFENNTLKRNDDGLYEHRGLIVAGFIDQQSAWQASYHGNTLSDVAVTGNRISGFRTGIIVTGSAGNGANAHSVENVTVSANTVSCQAYGDFGIIAAGAAISGYGGSAFCGSADCLARDIEITGNTVTAPGGILLAGTYVDSPVKTTVAGNALSGASICGNHLNAAAGVPEHMHLPGIAVADIAERWNGTFADGTLKAGNSAGKPEISGNDCNGFMWSKIDFSGLAAEYAIGSDKTAAQVLSEISAFSDAAAGAHLYDWAWDGAQFSAAAPAKFTAKGTGGTGDGIGALYKSAGILNVYSTYTVTFEPNGGTRTGGGELSQAVEYSRAASAPEVARPGYTFGGWYRDSACAAAWDFSRDTVTGNITLYAKWEPIPAPAAVPVALSVKKTNATLYGASNGSITAAASGGNSGAYEYSVNGGASWQSSGYFEKLAAGAYTVCARDAGNAGNSVSATVAIEQPKLAGRYYANRIPSRMNAGTAIVVKPVAPPKGYTLKSVTFSSGNKSVAVADRKGNVTFLKGGTVRITVTMQYRKTGAGGKTLTKTVKLTKQIAVCQKVSSVRLNTAKVTLAVRKRITLKATVSPSSATNRKVTWKSSNPKVASVSSGGVVTARKKGKAVITCTAQDGSRRSASCAVTVR